MKLEVLDIKGKPTGREVTLDKKVFGIEPNEHVVYLAVKQYLANQRQGTHKSKERGEITGSRRKLKRQKGTGTARFGDIKNPIFRGGGRIFGPRPRNYGFKLNKKVKQLARKSALSYKAKEKNIAVLEDFTFETPKTKDFSNMLSKLAINESKTLFVLPETNKELYLSGRNIPNTKITTAGQLNTYDVIEADKLVILESSMEKIESMFN